MITIYDESELWFLLVSFVCCQINIKIPAAPKPSSLVQSWLSKIKTLQRLSHGSKRTIMALDGLECHQSVWTENPESSGQTRPPPPHAAHSNPLKWFCFRPSCHFKYPMVLFSYCAPSVTFPLCLCVFM